LQATSPESRQPVAGATRSWAAPAAAVACIAAGVGVRLALLADGLPRFDSDEGTMGIMALHVAHHGEWPAFFYGQPYMGSLEAYLGAIAFRIFGASDFSLRAGLLPLYAMFVVASYSLLRIAYDRRAALLGLPLLVFGSQEILSREDKAVGGYPELLLFGASLLLVAAWLAQTAVPALPDRRRAGAFALWGLLAGAGIWSDPLTLPFVVSSGLLLAICCGRELTRRNALLLVSGALLGLSPAILYNLGSGATVRALWHIVSAGGSGHTSPSPAPFLERIAGAFLVSIPVETGGDALCRIPPQNAWPITVHSSRQVLVCTGVHGAWSVSGTALWALAAWTGTRSVTRIQRRYGRGEIHVGSASLYRRRALTQLAVLAPAALTLGFFVLSPASAHAPWYNVRYLTGLWVTVPAVLGPLASRALPQTGGRLTVSGATCVLPGALVLATLVLGTATYFDDRYTPWLNHQFASVSTTLLRAGDRRVYADYWICDWLAFETKEAVMCAALGPGLRPSLDRYGPYRVAVRSSRYPAYVFLEQSVEAAQLRSRLGPRSHRFRRISIAPYVLYLPARAKQSRLAEGQS